jgi:hypothetical protein
MNHMPVHWCECPLCQSPEPHPGQAFHHHINLFLSRLNAPQRRWLVALEALRIGHGGKHLLAQITGMSPTTILRGVLKSEALLRPNVMSSLSTSISSARTSIQRGIPSSGSTRKNETIGDFKNAGKTWSKVAESVLVHDWPQDAIGQAVP